MNKDKPTALPNRFDDSYDRFNYSLRLRQISEKSKGDKPSSNHSESLGDSDSKSAHTDGDFTTVPVIINERNFHVASDSFDMSSSFRPSHNRRHSNGSLEDKGTHVPPDVSLLNSRQYGSTSSIDAIQKTKAKVTLSADCVDAGLTRCKVYPGASNDTSRSSAKEKHGFGFFRSFRKNNSLGDLEGPVNEMRAKHYFVHFDCQSSMWRSSDFVFQCEIQTVPRRKNTGASAAATSRQSETDAADEHGIENRLLKACPYFLNEVGGEAVYVPTVTKLTSHPDYNYNKDSVKLPSANSASLLIPLPPDWHNFEYEDSGATYYRQFFYTFEEHQNWFGYDAEVGPIAVSARRRRVISKFDASVSGFLWYIIIRSKELRTLRGAILEEAVPTHLKYSSNKGVPMRDILHFIAPHMPLPCLRLGKSEAKTHDELLSIDEQVIMNKYKVGVLLCKAGQSTEEDMYNNEHSSPALDEFMDLLASRIKLENFDRFRGGLDGKTNSTGSHAYFTEFLGCEVVFHVSTMLPFTTTNRQQLLRKKHIGNDIVTIIFQEPGSLPFSPRSIRSQFQHVFVVVQVEYPCTDRTGYRVAVARSADMPTFGPPFSKKHIFKKDKTFREFILRKIINGENAAFQSPKFMQMQKRTREDRLKNLSENHSTLITLDSKANRFLLGSGRRKSGKSASNSNSNLNSLFLELSESLAFDVILRESKDREMNCQLLIGAGFLVVQSSIPLVSVPVRSMLAWKKTTPNVLTLFYHRGETMRFKCPTEEVLVRIVRRLEIVTFDSKCGESLFCKAEEVSLYRQDAVTANLGFGVQTDVFYVRTVDSTCLPRVTKNSRLVELCGQYICSVPEQQVFDILESSTQLELTLIPPDNFGAMRKAQEVTDIFLTNRAYKLFFANTDWVKSNGKPAVPAKPMVNSHMKVAAESGASSPSGGGSRYLDATFLPAHKVDRSKVMNGSNSNGGVTVEKLKRLINLDLTEDQIRQEDDWSQLVQTASRFEASAAVCSKCVQLTREVEQHQKRITELVAENERLKTQNVEAKQNLVRFTEKFFSTIDTHTNL